MSQLIRDQMMPDFAPSSTSSTVMRTTIRHDLPSIGSRMDDNEAGSENSSFDSQMNDNELQSGKFSC